MAKYRIVAMSTPVPGKKLEFHEWYEKSHIPEVLAFPGMKGAQRHEHVMALMGDQPNQWMVIFDIELDDPQVLLEAMGKAGEEGRGTPTDAVDMSTVQMSLFREVGERFVPA